MGVTAKCRCSSLSLTAMLLSVTLAARDAGDAVPPPDCVTEDGSVPATLVLPLDANSGLVCTCGSPTAAGGAARTAAMPGDDSGEAARVLCSALPC